MSNNKLNWAKYNLSIEILKILKIQIFVLFCHSKLLNFKDIYFRCFKNLYILIFNGNNTRWKKIVQMMVLIVLIIIFNKKKCDKVVMYISLFLSLVLMKSKRYV